MERVERDARGDTPLHKSYGVELLNKSILTPIVEVGDWPPILDTPKDREGRLSKGMAMREWSDYSCDGTTDEDLEKIRLYLENEVKSRIGKKVLLNMLTETQKKQVSQVEWKWQ